jgi:hypothetical protein
MIAWSDNAPVDVFVIAAGAIGPVGAEGLLELAAERDGELIEHVGRYRYCGVHEEQHLFTSADTGAPVYLHGHEIRSFR